MNYFDKTKLDEFYNGLFEKNKLTLLSGGVGDKYLTSPNSDNRMSLALLIRVNPSVSSEINDCIKELKSIEPDIYYYPVQDFHLTVMDILRGTPNRAMPDNLNDYIQCVEECRQKIKPFCIEFAGLTASDNAVMVKGYYERELEQFRQLLRQSLKNAGLALEERYKTFSAHITIARIPVKLSNPIKFVDYISSNEKLFGINNVTNFELVFHNWYDSKKIICY